MCVCVYVCRKIEILFKLYILILSSNRAGKKILLGIEIFLNLSASFLSMVFLLPTFTNRL